MKGDNKVLGVIPVRLGSTRLPNKPLADINGMTLVERVWRQANRAKLDRLVVSTPDAEILAAVTAFGGEAILTSDTAATGSDRVAETVTKLGGSHSSYGIIVNIQGDIPFINPVAIESLVAAFRDDKTRADMGTIATAITSDEELNKNSTVKVVTGLNSHALYFSRAPIPNRRDTSQQLKALKHIGLYCYTPQLLEKFNRLSEGPLESSEKLEQLRVLENGYKILVVPLDSSITAPNIEVDTAADLDRARDYSRLIAAKV